MGLFDPIAKIEWSGEWFPNWSWEDTWMAALLGAVLFGIVLFGTWAFSTKDVQYYYLNDSQSKGTCVAAKWQWNPDQTVYCSDDYQRAMDFLSKANQYGVKK